MYTNYECINFFFLEVKREYDNHFVNGYLGKYVIEFVNKHRSYPQVVSLDQAVAMGCLENCSTYFPTCKVRFF